jgi:hypothetical protein
LDRDLIWAHKKRIQKGYRVFHKSIKMDFQDPNAYHALGITYCMAGDEHLGSKFLLKAGVMFLKEGDTRTALSIYDVLAQIKEKDYKERLASAIENLY